MKVHERMLCGDLISYIKVGLSLIQSVKSKEATIQRNKSSSVRVIKYAQIEIGIEFVITFGEIIQLACQQAVLPM